MAQQDGSGAANDKEEAMNKAEKIESNTDQLNTEVSGRLQPRVMFFKSDNIEDVTPEENCAMPRYYPGDIILTKAGEVGIIKEAKVIINGGRVEWNEKLPENIEHGWPSGYSLDSIPGFPSPSKVAWWTADEWDKVAKGVLHRILD